MAVAFSWSFLFYPMRMVCGYRKHVIADKLYFWGKNSNNDNTITTVKQIVKRSDVIYYLWISSNTGVECVYFPTLHSWLRTYSNDFSFLEAKCGMFDQQLGNVGYKRSARTRICEPSYFCQFFNFWCKGLINSKFKVQTVLTGPLLLAI